MNPLLLLLAGMALWIIPRAGADSIPTVGDPFQALIQDIDDHVAPTVTDAPKVTIKDDATGQVVKTITGGDEMVSDVRSSAYPDGRAEEKAVRIRHVTFRSVPVYIDNAYHDDTSVYAQIAMPADAKPTDKLPGILILHGGAGFAQSKSMYLRVQQWAAAGYVAVACDLPGISGPKFADVSSGAWLSVPYEHIPRFVATPDIRASWIYTAEGTALKAFSLLRAQPAVDPSRLGIVGISWGGYSTTLLCGLLGHRVAAGFSVFGCGFYDEDSAWKQYFVNHSTPGPTVVDPWKQGGSATWLTYLDAGRRAAGIKAHFYLAASANDHFFRPPAVVRTLKAISTSDSLDFQFSPNAQPDPNDHDPAHDIAYYCTKSSHQILTPGGTRTPPASQPAPITRGWCAMEAVFFDHWLKGIGAPPSHIALEGSPQSDPQKNLLIHFTVDADPSVTLQVPQLRYSLYTPADTWEKRNWLTLDVPITSGPVTGNVHHYSVTMPAAIAGEAVDWYELVSDARGTWETTTSTLVESTPAAGAAGAR